MLELALPNTHAIAVMALIIVALILFTRDHIPLQTTSLLVLVALTVGFTVFPFESDGQVLQASDFFLGFGHKALVAVCGLMIVGEGLIRTGALEPVGRFLAKLWRRGPAISLLFTILITAVLSAFINNTPIVVLMLPILMGVAVRMGESPSGTLLPMGFASILGGMATTIGTSTNLLVVNVAADMGMDSFNMFDFLGPASIAGGVALMNRAWEDGLRPTAVLAMSDAMAIGAMHALRDLRVDVPGDVSVVGFDDIDLAPHVDPPLTTVHQPIRRKGEEAARLLLTVVERRDLAKPEHRRLETRLIVRASTGPVPNHRKEVAGDRH